MAMMLCLPSPACRDMVGEKVRGGKVDLFYQEMAGEQNMIGSSRG